MTTLRGDLAAIYDALAISPDGTTLAASSFNVDGEYTDGSAIKLWDLETGEERGTLTDPGGAGTGMVFGPDGDILAAANHNFGTLNLFDVRAGDKTVTLAAHVASPEAIAISRDGRTLATGSGRYETDTDSTDFSIRLWDLAGKQLAELDGHEESVLCLAFSPDGKTLASGSDDTTIRLWHVASGVERVTLSGRDVGQPQSLSFSPDGRTLAVGDFDAVKLWDLRTLKVVATFPPPGSSTVFRVEYSPDGNLLAAAYYGVQLWDVASKKKIATLGDPENVSAMTFSPDGRTIAVTGQQGSIDLWAVR